MKKVLFIAAALLTLAACNRAPQQPDVTTYNLTVEVPALTKALSLDGSTLDAVWATGETVTVFIDDTAVGTLTPKTVGDAATVLKGTITADLEVGTQMRLLTPKKGWIYSNQDGTLAGLSKYAFAQADIAVEAINGDDVTAGPAAFEHQQAIVEFTFIDEAGDPVYPESLVINADSDLLVNSLNDSMDAMTGPIELDALAGDTNVIYVAIRNDASGDDTYNLEAIAGAHTYYASATAELIWGVFYKVTVTLLEDNAVYTVAGSPASLFGTEWDASNTDNDMVKQADGTYKKEYNLTARAVVSFKIVKDHSWDNEYPQGYGNNIAVVANPGPVVITFDPVSEEITVDCDEVTDFEFTIAGTPASVFGTEWDPANTANDLEFEGNGIYSKTYSGVAAGTQLKFKVCVDHSWGMSHGASNSNCQGDGDGNCLWTTSGGDVTISFNSTTNYITVSE